MFNLSNCNESRNHITVNFSLARLKPDSLEKTELIVDQIRKSYTARIGATRIAAINSGGIHHVGNVALRIIISNFYIAQRVRLGCGWRRACYWRW